jgi:Na+/proline symporter
MDTGRFLRRDSLYITVVGGLATLVAYLSVPRGSEGDLGWYIFFLLWALSPYAAFFLLAKRVHRRGASRVVFLGALVNLALCITVLADAWAWRTDVQGGIDFLTVPAQQWGVFAITLVAAGLAALLSQPRIEDDVEGDEETGKKAG